MTEQQRFSVVDRLPGFELRRYEACVVAEVVVDGSLEGAGNRAFRRLVSYIGGQNRTGRRLAMTAPVVQEPAGRRIAMTAPVVQQEREGGAHVVAFVMPAGETLDTLPVPTDPSIVLRAVPEELAAASRYSGRWTESAYHRQVSRLQDAVARAGLTVTGPARWARFDPPWTPSFLRHNEVVLPVAAAAG